MICCLILFLGTATNFGSMDGDAGELSVVRVPLVAGREVDVADLVEKLGRATGAKVSRPHGNLSVPVVGVGGGVSRNALADLLGPTASVSVEGMTFVVGINAAGSTPESQADWERRLKKLAEHVESEARRQANYGMHALSSYRPNDSRRPTVCLVHGLNSSSGGFVHMIPQIEAAGYGVVIYDYPYNLNLNTSGERFQRDWKVFRQQWGEKRSWAIVAHSMGALISRFYVENDAAYLNDVSDLILIAPVNQGSSLAKAQTLLQLLRSVQAVQGNKPAEALSHLGDGLGEAATNLLPGSAFLTALNRRPRRAGVAYHILAGDVGFVSHEMRTKVEARLDSLRQGGGFLGGLTRFVTSDVEDQLDEVSDGTGDGCVTVARTRLAGVSDHATIHANHAELIRAPLLFRDPGPVPCMPYLLKWLARKESPPAARGPR